jgi:radical SAM protein with 4Fe4S-binding SPASM domain
VQCEANFVPTKVNVHQFKGIVDFTREHGMKRLSVLRFVPQGRGLENRQMLELSRIEEDRFIDLLLELRQLSEVDIRTGSPFNNIVPGNSVACRAGSHKLVVQASGNVLPCEVYKHGQRCNWALSAHGQSIGQILNSPQVKRLRKSLDRDSCLKCPIHTSLRSQQETGDDCGSLSKATILS